MIRVWSRAKLQGPGSRVLARSFQLSGCTEPQRGSPPRGSQELSNNSGLWTPSGVENLRHFRECEPMGILAPEIATIGALQVSRGRTSRSSPEKTLIALHTTSVWSDQNRSGQRQNQTVYQPTSNIFALMWRRASNEESKIPVSCYQISFGQPEALPVAPEKLRR